MTQLSVDMHLTEQENRELEAEAQKAGVSIPALAERWVQERLLHEREKALGINKPGLARSQGDFGAP